MKLSRVLMCVLASGIVPGSNAKHAGRQQHEALIAFGALQSWYNTTSGVWDTTGWWNAANIVTIVGDLVQAEAQDSALRRYVTNIFALTVTRGLVTNPQPGLEGSSLYRRSEPVVAAADTQLKSKYHRSFDMGARAVSWNQTTSTNITLPVAIRLPTVSEFAHTSTGLNVYDWLDGYYDDDLWWALAWINAYDVTNDTAYLNLAESIFGVVSKNWPTHCFNGGIYWNHAYWNHGTNYINAITNELFLSTAAHLANRVKNANDTLLYEAFAMESVDWFLDSGMINPNGTINDGMTPDCKNNAGPIWTYNQGVIIGGLVELHRRTHNATYISLAHSIANATLTHLTDSNGILHDLCEPTCGADGTQFKGVFMRNLQRLYRHDKRKEYASFIHRNARSIWDKSRNGGSLGVNWAGPWVQGDAATQSSAMEAFVAELAIRPE